MDYEHELQTGWCSECHEECFYKTIDQGLGPYEYWGYKGVHHDYVEASSCCEAEVLDYDPREEE